MAHGVCGVCQVGVERQVHGLWVRHGRRRLLFFSPPQTRRLRVQVPLCGINVSLPCLAPNNGGLWFFISLFLYFTLTSDLLLQAEDHRHSLMQHQQLGLRLLALQMQLAHVTQLLEGLVDVPHAQAFAGVVGHPPLTLALGLLLRAQVLVFMGAASAKQVRFS